MYKFKTNKETKALELVTSELNIHPLVLDKKSFDMVYSREYARFEYFTLVAKMHNDYLTDVEHDKLELLETTFHFDSLTECETSFDGLHPSLHTLMTVTLIAHDKLLKRMKVETVDNKEKYTVIKKMLTLGNNDKHNFGEFYRKCKKVVNDIETGVMTLEQGVQSVKQIYNNSCDIINCDAVENICKKWEQSTKENNTRAFLLGLTNDYKMTRNNTIKKESPLKNQVVFERYFAMWIATNGKMTEKTKKIKEVETLDSFLGTVRVTPEKSVMDTKKATPKNKK